jgi:hypothetical protein
MTSHPCRDLPTKPETDPEYIAARDPESGRAVEAVLELVVLIAVVPPLICCFVQAALALVAIALPWAAFVIITALLCACIGTLSVGRRRHLPPAGPPPQQAQRLALPPIRRPSGQSGSPRRPHP